jgi:hypothetical protein
MTELLAHVIPVVLTLDGDFSSLCFFSSFFIFFLTCSYIDYLFLGDYVDRGQHSRLVLMQQSG